MNLATAISRSKNKLNILLLLLATLHVQAQKEHSYIPLLDTGKVWYTVQGIEFGGFESMNITPDYENVFTANDTVYYSIDGFVIVREDTAEQKVYNRYFSDYNTPSAPEYLIYDFSLNEGDSIYFNELTNICSGIGWYTVDSVRIKTFFGTDRKIYYLNEKAQKSPYTIIWIEGIGSLAGIQYYNSFPMIYDWQCGELTCCYLNNELLYQSYYGELYGCSFEYLDINECNNFDVKIYPNPVSCISKLEFNNPDAGIFTLYIYDFTGKLINIETTSNAYFLIEKNTNSKGLYFCKLFTDNKEIYSEKFIIR